MKTAFFVDLDEVFNSLGVWGKWQLTQFSLIQAQHLAAAFQLLAIVFLGYEPPFTCLGPRNETNFDEWGIGTNSSTSPFIQEQCVVRNTKTNATSRCDYGYAYSLPKSATIVTEVRANEAVTEWNLICDKEYQVGLTQTIFIAGQAFGATIATMLADRYGRKWVCILSQWAVMALSIGTAFSPNILVFTILRFPLGALQQGIIMTGSVLPLELLPVEKRAMVHFMGSFTWSVCLTALAGFGYVFRYLNWRYLQIVLSSMSLIVIVHTFVLDESVRWLYANGLTKKAAAILRKAVRMNKAEVNDTLQMCMEAGSTTCTGNNDVVMKSINIDGERPKDAATIQSPKDETIKIPADGTLLISRQTSGEETTHYVKKYTVLDVIRHKRLLLTALVLFIAWIVNSLVYFGLTLASSKLVGDRFLNFFLIAVVELPAGLLSFFTMQWIGRRSTIIIFDAIAGSSLIVAVALKTVYGSSVETWVTGLSVVGKFGASAAFGSLFVYTPELYPTNLRSLGLGMSSAASRIGGMIAPFSTILMKYVPWAPGAIFGGLSLAVCVLLLFLPETRDKNLPRTIEEIKQWSKREKIKTATEKIH